MKNLLSLVASLKSSEVKLVRSYYANGRGNADFGLREKLLTLALAKPDCSNDEAQKYLYGRKKEAAFSHLKQRLKSDILNMLLLQEGDIRFRSRYAQAVFNCRRAVIHGELLLSRGVYEEALEVLQRAADIAEKNELYAELVQISDIYRTHLVMKDPGRDFSEVSRLIDTSVILLQKSVRAKFHHYELTVPGLYRNCYGKTMNGAGHELLEEMRRDYEETDSPRIGFYYHISAVNYLADEGDYAASLGHAHRLLQLVKKAPAFQSDSFTAGANMEIANALIRTEDYLQAESHANTALRLFRKGMLNELFALEKLFYCYIRTAKFAQASEVITRAFGNAKIDYNEMLNARWWYFKAVLDFMKGNHSRAISSLKHCEPLQRDRTGWMTAISLFEIICRVESGQYEWMDMRIESLRKVFSKLKETELSPSDARMDSGFRIARTLRRMNYDFELTQKEEAKNILALSAPDGKMRWDPAGPELIRFENWFSGKLTGERKQKEKRQRARVGA